MNMTSRTNKGVFVDVFVDIMWDHNFYTTAKRYYEMCNFSFYEYHKAKFYSSFTRKLHYIAIKVIKRNFCS